MASFNRADYAIVYNFAREQFFWHECTGRGYDLKAALIMSLCEDVIGQQSDFPIEARERIAETPKAIRHKIMEKLREQY